MTNHRNKQNYRFRTWKFKDRYHLKGGVRHGCFLKIVSEYDQEIPQSQTADNPRQEPLNHHETPGRRIKQSNQLSLPHQDDCNT